MRSKTAIKNIIVSLLLQFTTVVCGLIIPRMIIGRFGSSVNGLISSITQFLAYITLLESGIGPVIRATLYKPIAEKKKDDIANILNASEKFFKTLAYIFIAYLLILMIAFPIFMQNEFEIFFTMSLVFIIAISTFSEYYFGMTYQLYLQAEQKTYITSGLQIFTTILNAVMIIILIKSGMTIQSVKIASAIIFLIRPIIQNIYVKKKYNISLKDADKNYKLEQKWDGLAQHVAAIVHNNTDVTILTIFSTMANVSVYMVYYMIVSGVKRIVEALTGGISATFGDMLARDEKENLNITFKAYETFYHTITTVIFICTLILIVPFIEVYTNGITDVNYIRPVFACLIVLAEFMHSIRLPYSSLILAAGHFKETKKGAWIESIINIVLSVILVIKYGIDGVAVGTLIAMFVRTIEFMIHSSKNILNRSIIYTLKRMGVIGFQVIVVALINSLFFTNIEINSYLTWIYYALKIGLISAAIVIFINFIVYKNDFKEIFKKVKNIFAK